MGDKSPKSKSKNQAQKTAADAKQKKKNDKRQAGFDNSADKSGKPGKSGK